MATASERVTTTETQHRAPEAAVRTHPPTVHKQDKKAKRDAMVLGVSSGALIAIAVAVLLAFVSTPAQMGPFNRVMQWMGYQARPYETHGYMPESFKKWGESYVPSQEELRARGEHVGGYFGEKAGEALQGAKQLIYHAPEVLQSAKEKIIGTGAPESTSWLKDKPYQHYAQRPTEGITGTIRGAYDKIKETIPFTGGHEAVRHQSYAPEREGITSKMYHSAEELAAKAKHAAQSAAGYVGVGPYAHEAAHQLPAGYYEGVRKGTDEERLIREAALDIERMAEEAMRKAKERIHAGRGY